MLGVAAAARDPAARAAADPDAARPGLGGGGRAEPRARPGRPSCSRTRRRTRWRSRPTSKASWTRSRPRAPAGPTLAGRGRDRATRPISPADARLRPHRARGLAGHPGRARRDATPPGAATPCSPPRRRRLAAAPARRARDRGRVDRLHPGHGPAPGRHRAPAARRRGAARARPRPRRGGLGGDRRPRRRDGGQHGHPQFMLRRLLDGASRPRPRPPSGRSAPATPARAAPPAASPRSCGRPRPPTSGRRSRRTRRERTRGRRPRRPRPVEAADEREEALAIAIALRETLASPGRRAALVTPRPRPRPPGRGRARALGSIAAFDSAGIRARRDAAGPPRPARGRRRGARLPRRSPSWRSSRTRRARSGWRRADLERGAVAPWNSACCAGPRPGRASRACGPRSALRRAERGRPRARCRARRLEAGDWDAAADLLGRLEARLRGRSTRRPGGRPARPRRAWRGRHAPSWPRSPPARRTMRTSRRRTRPRGGPAPPLRRSRARRGSRTATGARLRGRFADYPAFFAALARTAALAPEGAGAHPRDPDPGPPRGAAPPCRPRRPGRPRRDRLAARRRDGRLPEPAHAARLGLTPPERRIGQTAHDFVQALGHADALVTRARKRDGKPTVPSRFLERMRAFVGDDRWEAAIGRGERYRAARGAAR